jgi:hypothetical protein
VLRDGAVMKLTDVKPDERVDISFTTRNHRQIVAEVDVLARKSRKTQSSEDLNSSCAPVCNLART